MIGGEYQMIKSMTGFGRGEYAEDRLTFTVEIKSVNHRYNDVSVKIPRMFSMLEERVRKISAKYVNRGKVDIYISYDLYEQDIEVKIDEKLVQAYIKSLQIIKDKYGITDNISLGLLTKFPDVLKPERVEQDEEQAWAILEKALAIAFEKFMSMRQREGQHLMTDIEGKVDKIEKMVNDVENIGTDFLDYYKEKLLKRIQELTKSSVIDTERVLLEAAIMADKTCIDEELVRMHSHIKEFRKTINSEDTIGKKLDFIVQEMNREVNTMGSKAADAVITKIVVDIKYEIEKIREQIQNIE